MGFINNFAGKLKSWFSSGWTSAGFFSVMSAFRKPENYYFGTVYTCIDLIAQNVSAIEYYLVRRDDAEKRIYSHEFLSVLNKPNMFMTGADLMYIISAHIDTHGGAFIYPVMEGSKITGFVPLYPQNLTVVRGKGIYDMVKGYKYIVDGQQMPLNVDEVIPIMRPNPYDMVKGVSTIEMARFEIEADYNSITWNAKFYENGAIPSGVLSTDKNLDETAFKRLKQEWEEKYQGKENAHKTAILFNGLKYDSIAPKQKDMDFIESRRYSRDQILSIFKVPKAMIAISDDVNRANAEAAHYIFSKNVLKPRVRLIFEKLNRFYLSKVDVMDRFKIEYENPVPEDKQYTLERKEKQTKWVTINETRQEEGREPIPDGDLLYEEYLLKRTRQALPQGNSEKKKSLSNREEQRALYIELKNEYLDDKESEQNVVIGKHYRRLVSLIKINKRKSIHTKSTVDDVLEAVYPDTTDWKQELLNLLEKMGSDTIRESLNVNDRLFGLKLDFNLANLNAAVWLSENAKRTTETYDTTLRDRARVIIAEEMKNETFDISSLKKRVAEVIASEEYYRVERMVRTELNGSYNKASSIAYNQTKSVVQKEWSTSGDERVRPAHVAADGQRVSKQAAFIVDGEKLNEPGDKNGSPGNIINCRCTSYPVFADEV